MSQARARIQLAVWWILALLAAVTLPGPTTLMAEVADPSPEVALGAVVTALAVGLSWLVTLWGGLILVVGAAAHAPSVIGIAAGRVLTAVTPAVTRRAVGLALGLAIVGASPTYAAVPGISAQPDRAAVTAEDLPVIDLDLDWTPQPQPAEDRAAPATELVATAVPQAAPTTKIAPAGEITDGLAGRRAPAAPTSITVRPGDCLWSIASAALPVTASAAEIDAAWRSWYLANIDVIGSDPDLLIPGQVLRAPADTAAETATPPLPGGHR